MTPPAGQAQGTNAAASIDAAASGASKGTPLPISKQTASPKVTAPTVETPASPDQQDPSADGVFSRVAAVIGAIRPAVQDDGGDLELVEITENGIVKIRFHGACVGCPSSSMTLKEGVERNVRERVPEIVAVEQVD